MADVARFSLFLLYFFDDVEFRLPLLEDEEEEEEEEVDVLLPAWLGLHVFELELFEECVEEEEEEEDAEKQLEFPLLAFPLVVAEAAAAAIAVVFIVMFMFMLVWLLLELWPLGKNVVVVVVDELED